MDLFLSSVIHIDQKADAVSGLHEPMPDGLSFKTTSGLV